MIEYQLIQDFYGDKVAKRSQVPLMNHIDEGLTVLNAINASMDTKRAFCIHPLVQGDYELTYNMDEVLINCSPFVIMLAMEYRNIANQSLSDKWSQSSYPLSPIKEVNDMLIADKVQNYKDFIIYHLTTHPRSNELVQYFETWLTSLNVTPDEYYTYTRLINDHTRSHLA